MRAEDYFVGIGGVIGIIFIVALIGFTLFGYGANIVKLVKCDFQEPYTEEVMRAVGVPVGPLGVILGYVDFPAAEED